MLICNHVEFLATRPFCSVSQCKPAFRTSTNVYKHFKCFVPSRTLVPILQRNLSTLAAPTQVQIADGGGTELQINIPRLTRYEPGSRT